MKKEGCEYCGRPGKRRAGPEDGLAEDAYACDPCWKLLQDPVTALPLLRGHLSLEMRGSSPGNGAERAVSAFIEGVAPWRPRQPGS